MKSLLITTAKSLVLGAIILFSVGLLSAEYTPPPGGPTAGNPPTFLNVGPAPQGKQGALKIGGIGQPASGTILDVYGTAVSTSLSVFGPAAVEEVLAVGVGDSVDPDGFIGNVSSAGASLGVHGETLVSSLAGNGVIPVCANSSGILIPCDNPPPAPECANSIDDDGDGLVDMADPGCSCPSNPGEATSCQEPPQCPVLPGFTPCSSDTQCNTTPGVVGACTGGGCSSVPDTTNNGCFLEGTMITMADGSVKAIEDIVPGDQVQAVDGVNTVQVLVRPLLGDQDTYSINGSDAFFTANHPFLTTDGWKSLDPETTMLEIPELDVTMMEIGDVLVHEDGNVVISSIEATPAAPDTQLYNFELDGDHTYYADGYAVHNKINPIYGWCQPSPLPGYPQRCIGTGQSNVCEYNSDCPAYPDVGCDGLMKRCTEDPVPNSITTCTGGSCAFSYEDPSCASNACLGTYSILTSQGACESRNGDQTDGILTDGPNVGATGPYANVSCSNVPDTVCTGSPSHDGSPSWYSHGCRWDPYVPGPSGSCSVFNQDQATCQATNGCTWAPDVI